LPNASQIFIQNTVFDTFEFAGLLIKHGKMLQDGMISSSRKKLAASFIVASIVAEMNPRYVAPRNLLI